MKLCREISSLSRVVVAPTVGIIAGVLISSNRRPEVLIEMRRVRSSCVLGGEVERPWKILLRPIQTRPTGPLRFLVALADNSWSRRHVAWRSARARDHSAATVDNPAFFGELENRRLTASVPRDRIGRSKMLASGTQNRLYAAAAAVAGEDVKQKKAPPGTAFGV